MPDKKYKFMRAFWNIPKSALDGIHAVETQLVPAIPLPLVAILSSMQEMAFILTISAI